MIDVRAMFGVALIACSRPPVVTAETDASAAVANDSHHAVASSTPSLVDAATSRTCRVTYDCGLSHPGLGTSTRSTSVDLETCTKTRASSSGPYNHAPAPLPSASASAPVPTKLAPTDCEHLRDLVTAITADDAKLEQESAHMDSEACSLTVMCGAARDQQKISVQRQSPSTGHVGQVIRAL